MTNETICSLCLKAITNVGYNESMIRNYRGGIKRFKKFCSEHDVIDYSCGIGKLYADDVISSRTGKFSNNRYHT